MACACLQRRQKSAEQTWLQLPARALRLVAGQAGWPAPACAGCQLATSNTLCPAPRVPSRAHSREAPHLGVCPGLLAGVLQLLLACSGWKWHAKPFLMEASQHASMVAWKGPEGAHVSRCNQFRKAHSFRWLCQLQQMVCQACGGYGLTLLLLRDRTHQCAQLLRHPYRRCVCELGARGVLAGQDRPAGEAGCRRESGAGGEREVGRGSKAWQGSTGETCSAWPDPARKLAMCVRVARSHRA